MTIENGIVIGFAPDRLQKANIGIKDGKIAAIATSPIRGARSIDAEGKYVAPGFIDFHSHVAGKLFSAECVLRQGATTTIGGEQNFDGKLIRQISEHGFLINHGFHISESFTLRRAVGMRDDSAGASASEIADMKVLLAQFLRNGAFAVHFALEYVPGTSEDELAGIAETAKDYDRVLLIHMRGDGNTVLGHFGEVERVMRRTGVSVHLVHLAYMAGYRGVMPKALEILRRMRDDGLDITADTGLYAAFPNCMGSPLLAGNWTDRYENVSVNKVMISSGIYSGEFCTQEKFKNLRENFPSTLVTVFAGDESEIAGAIKEPYMFISSNAADGPHYENVGHPETAGTFPRLIGRYVRARGILSLSDAIRKITWGPAQRFRIPNKGNLAVGCDADIVVFDLESICDKADYVGFGDPNAPPLGIEYVLVNGEPVCRGTEVSGEKRTGVHVKAG